MGKKKSISAQGSNSDGDSGCSGFSSPLLLLLLPLLLLLRLTTTKNSTALGTVTWWLLVATVTHARARMRQRQRSRGGGGVVVCAVGVFLFAFRFVVLFSLRFVYSSACLLAFACVRAWEWVSRRGTSHNSLWFSRRTRAVGGEKQPFTLSLSFSLSASHSFSLLLTFVTCFSCCCSYLCRCRLLFYAHVAKKHTRRVAGSRQSETRVAFRCRQDRNLCLCMWNVCWVRLRLLSRSLSLAQTHTQIGAFALFDLQLLLFVVFCVCW